MRTFPLRLIPAAAEQPVRAGFLPGSDVGAWLEEMVRQPGARFFVVPSSVEEASAGGLLIVPATGKAVKMCIRDSLPDNSGSGRMQMEIKPWYGRETMP